MCTKAKDIFFCHNIQLCVCVTNCKQYAKQTETEPNEFIVNYIVYNKMWMKFKIEACMNTVTIRKNNSYFMITWSLKNVCTHCRMYKYACRKQCFVLFNCNKFCIQQMNDNSSYWIWHKWLEVDSWKRFWQINNNKKLLWNRLDARQPANWS